MFVEVFLQRPLLRLFLATAMTTRSLRMSSKHLNSASVILVLLQPQQACQSGCLVTVMLIALFFDFLKGLSSSFDAIGMQVRKRSQKPYFEQCGRCSLSKRHVRLVQFQLHKQNDTTGKSHALYENVRGFSFYTSKKTTCMFFRPHPLEFGMPQIVYHTATVIES